MRKPSSYASLFAWHSAAMNGEDPERHDGFPECGWYKRKLVKGGPWVPVRIFVEREIDPVTGELMSDEFLRCEVEGLDAGDPVYQWDYVTPISRDEYDRLIDAPLRDPRMADTKQAIDLSETPTLPQGVF